MASPKLPKVLKPTPAAKKAAAPAPVVVEGEDQLPTQEQIDAVAALADAPRATVSTGTDGEPVSPSAGDTDDAVLTVDPDMAVEGNDDDDAHDELIDAAVNGAKETNLPERAEARVGQGVTTDNASSLVGTIATYRRRDGELLSFDKLTTSKGERAALIAAFDAELD